MARTVGAVLGLSILFNIDATIIKYARARVTFVCACAKKFLLLPFCECIARSAVFGAVEFDN